MDWFTGLVAFLIIWWTALFTVLPFWVRQPEKTELGHMPGAPENPHLKRKFIATTVVASVVWLILFILVKIELVDFRGIAMTMIEEDLGR